ncbi:MAG TPA: DUF2997 domain-containing protein [bacterium]|nr:DUF2997 domain-containing protein [bacterium]
MKRQEIEIQIKETGETVVHIKGIKGKTCLHYAALLKEVLGPVKNLQYTSEYYEPETEVEITDRLEGKKRAP